MSKSYDTSDNNETKLPASDQGSGSSQSPLSHLRGGADPTDVNSGSGQEDMLAPHAPAAPEQGK